jgi:hypothetical protein
VQVPYSEDIASHAVPESCVSHREVRREALTGVRAGQLSSRESLNLIQGADAVSVAEGNTRRGAIASPALALRGLRTWHVRTLFVREPGDLLLDRRWHHRSAVRIGKARSRSR